MNINEVRDILASTNREEWLFNDERGAYTYTENLNLRIQRREIDHSRDRFSGEDWATKHPDPTAYRVTYEIYYGSSFIEDKLLVSVDGHRATLPMPKMNTNIVSSEDYKFAQIVDQLGTLEDYMDKAGLEAAGE